MEINHLQELVRNDFDAVNELIYGKIKSKVDLISNLANHLIQSGGKRIRPLLVLLTSNACNYKGNDHITLAAMVEFFHTATLLHDDVIDESTLRRGKETANEIWGSKASILVGDYLLTLYMQLMINVGNLDIMTLLSDTGHKITCGEIQQLGNRNNPDITLEEYYEVISAKTSLLFAASAALGGMISTSPKNITDSLYAYGLHLGNAFQIIDDSLDYCSDAKTIGKNIGDDLADGKATLPLIFALKHGTANQKLMIRESITQGKIETFPEIIEAIRETKAIEYTQKIASSEIDKAILALQVLPESVYKEALTKLANFAINRKH